jgi:hypothetical protein
MPPPRPPGPTGTLWLVISCHEPCHANETHTLEQVSFDAVITNPATGETFRDRGHSTVRFEPGLATGFTLSGIVFAIHAPGEGVLLLSVGRLITDSNFDTVFQSAQMLGLPETQAAVCASLG